MIETIINTSVKWLESPFAKRQQYNKEGGRNKEYCKVNIGLKIRERELESK